MERVLLGELALMADAFGPASAAARALEWALLLDNPTIVRLGSTLVVSEASVEDTIVIRRF